MQSTTQSSQSATRRDCNFHFKKALHRNLFQCDLGEEYSVPDSVVRSSYALGALAFVPETDVNRCWRHLKPLIPNDMASFVSYLRWVGTSTTDPLFSHDMWN